MIRRAASLVTGLVLLLAGCSPVALLDAVSPKADYETREAAYGPDPRQGITLYRPKTLTAPAPVVVFFYGGGWEGGELGDYRFAASALVSQGYVVAIPDYRVHPAVAFPAFVEDSARAVAWVKANITGFGGDAGRLFLVGHSAGAYNALMLALDSRFLAGAGLSPADLAGVVGLAGPYDFLPLSSAVLKTIFAAPDLAATQPVTFARADAPPLLLATGDEDTTVYPRNTRNLAARLRALGAAVETIEYPGLGHAGILSALSPLFRGRAPVLADVMRFIKARTGEPKS